MATATVKNLESVNRKFAKMSAAMKGRALERAGMAGILPIVNQAKIIVHKITGNLSRSIHAEPSEVSERQAIVRAGTNVEYAAAEELGNEHRPPHPYMRPAFDDKRDEAVHETAESLRHLVRGSVE